MASSSTCRSLSVVLTVIAFFISSAGYFVDAFLVLPTPSSCRPGFRHDLVTLSSTAMEAETQDISAPLNATTTVTREYAFQLIKEVPSTRKKRLLLGLFQRRKPEKNTELQQQAISFGYDSHVLTLNASNASSATGVILIHPIGVGIGKWFYNRLLTSLYLIYQSKRKPPLNLLVVAPDLLGSGTAANPMLVSSKSGNNPLKKLPLLQVNDWSLQMGSLMADLEQDFPDIQDWCVVANGGCSPIALQVAQKSVETQHNNNNATSSFQRPVTQVILSSVPRLPFFLPDEDNKSPISSKLLKVQKSYKTLCGIVGNFFWWYALRSNGAFVQKFSERNLVANATNLGEDWTPNCVATARMHHGKSRYSTFSFLAGSLQAEGCRTSLETLRHSGVRVDIVQGRDRRRNRAKSWFWQKRKPNNSNDSANNENTPPQEESLQQVLKRNGNRGDVIQVGGRISLAHEDAPGYARALLDFLA